MAPKPRDNKQYRDLSHALKRKGQRLNLPCWICDRSIDYELHWKHPMSYTYDHLHSLASGGAVRGEGRPAHRSCNSRRGNQRETPTVTPPVTSREW